MDGSGSGIVDVVASGLWATADAVCCCTCDCDKEVRICAVRCRLEGESRLDDESDSVALLSPSLRLGVVESEEPLVGGDRRCFSHIHVPRGDCG